MKTILCDYVGCNRAVRWIYAADGDGPKEIFLCQECWERLRETHPDKVGDYLLYHIYTYTNRSQRFPFFRER